MRFRKSAFFVSAAFVLVLVRAVHADEPVDLKALLAAPPAGIASLELPKDELKAIYDTHDDKPFWNFADTENTTAADAFIDSLSHLIAYHGLRAEDYPIDAMKKMEASKDDASRLELDMLVTASLLELAHDLHGDSVDLTDDYVGWTLERDNIDMPAALGAALANGTANDYIIGLAPKTAVYAKLATALQDYRAMAAKGGWGRIAPGPSIRPGEHSHRVQQIRARLEAEGYLSPSDSGEDIFDNTLEKAVKAYQVRNGLEPDGHAGAKTQEMMNEPISTRIEQIQANMERWRHMPDDFPPKRYVAVNIADASIRIIDNGEEIYAGPVVVGKVDRKTPFIHSNIRSMIVNPIWHVPTKIAQKDILPKLRKDPHYLEKLGFVISGHEGDPHGGNIDWASMPEREFNFRLRQAPGDQNSLGRLKFDFDNDFAVYMHGTPHQNLFAKAQRDFSSGCIRLRDPVHIGSLLMQGSPGDWTEDKIETEMDANKTRWVSIQNPMPLYVLYWSVFPGEDGAVNFREDVYDYDHIMENAPPPEHGPGIEK